jgi:rod shape-determining protein MreD
MKPQHRQGGQAILISLLIGLVLTILPLPKWVLVFRPDWIALILLYWCMATPHRVGVGSAWVLGLLLDVLHGSLLGQHALGLAVIAWIILTIHLRVRVFPLWQQAFFIMALLAINRILLLWVDGIIGQQPHSWDYWYPLLTGTLLWPWLFVVLRGVRRRYKVN